MKNIPIGEVLKEYGYITEEQLQQALDTALDPASNSIKVIVKP